MAGQRDRAGGPARAALGVALGVEAKTAVRTSRAVVLEEFGRPLTPAVAAGSVMKAVLTT